MTTRDRLHDYIPEGLHLPPPWVAEVGVRPGNRQFLPATWGSPDELNPEHGSWDWAKVRDENSPEGNEHWSHLVHEWHRVQVDVQLSTFNHREVHDWKGYDEIRPGGWWKLYLDRTQVAEGGAANPAEALLTIRHRLNWFLGGGGPHVSSWATAEKELIGRGVYYREQPGRITSTILDQGCIIITAETPTGKFSPPVWSKDDDQPYDDWEDDHAKVELWSPHIWWWRRG